MIDEKIKAEAERRYPLLTKSDLAEILKIPVGWVYDRELRNANESTNEQRDAFIAGANFGKEMREAEIAELRTTIQLLLDEIDRRATTYWVKKGHAYHRAAKALLPLPPEPGGE